MSAWATVEDVQDMYESTVPARTQAVLDRVERRLAQAVPDISSRIELDPDEDGYLDVDAVRDVVVDATIRLLQNPRGFTYERDGDYAVGYSKQGSGWFTDEELSVLRPVAAGGPRTIGVSPGLTPPASCPPPRDSTAWTGDRLAGSRGDLP